MTTKKSKKKTVEERAAFNANRPASELTKIELLSALALIGLHADPVNPERIEIKATLEAWDLLRAIEVQKTCL